jgi:hypothetical protein
MAAHTSKNLQIPAPRFSLPAELTQSSLVLASFGGAKQPVRPDSAAQASQQAIQQASAAAATVAPQAPTAAPATGKYTGEPISVNLKEVDLRDFFRLIHEISGLNVVLDPAVKGSLTIVLDEVPWDQALDIVLQNNGLDKQLNGNVLRIATRDTLKKEAETLRARAVAGEDVSRLQKEAYDAAGVSGNTAPNPGLRDMRRRSLPLTHAAVFDLKPGEVSPVISDTTAHYIYKMDSKGMVPLETVRKEIWNMLRRQRSQKMIESVQQPFNTEVNSAYFGADKDEDKD